MPPREADAIPWHEVAVDLIGPWKLQVQEQELEISALTCIDTVTNLTELVRIQNKTSAHVAEQFQNCWLSRYPLPARCVHNNGGEFIGQAFQELLQQAGIDNAPTTAYNPQANAICERMHQTVANILRTLTIAHPLQNQQQADQAVDTALATAMHAMRASVHQTLGIAPGALVFQRDMFLELPLIANLITLQQIRQRLIDKNLQRQNQQRQMFDYAIGQQVLVKAINPSKLQPRAHGPYNITQVFTKLL